MLEPILRKFLGTKHERDLKRMRPLVSAINELEPKIQALDDVGLRRKTFEFRERLEKGE
jgi:preprotein translocase subunit SecA